MNIHKAIKFIRVLEEGSTHPWVVQVLVKDEKLQKYVLKVFNPNTLAQYNAVAHEVIANQLAKLLDLHVPDIALIELDVDFLQALSQKEKSQIKSSDHRPKFGIVLIDNATTYRQSQKMALQEYEYEDIYAFDNLIYNTDRRVNKPNLLLKLDNYFLIDHELSFKGISENSIADLAAGQWKYNHQKHIFYPVLKQIKDKSRLFENFRYNLTHLNIKELEKTFLSLDKYGYAYDAQIIFLNYLRFVQENSRKYVTILKKQVL